VTVDNDDNCVNSYVLHEKLIHTPPKKRWCIAMAIKSMIVVHQTIISHSY